MRTRGQIWSLDIMAGLALFLVAIIILFIYSLNQPSQTKESFYFLNHDGKIIANNLLSEGYPKNWNTSNVITLGITTNNKINQSKLENIYEIIYLNNNYTKTKNLFGTQYDYYFFLDDNMTINSNSTIGIGKPGVTPNNINAKDLIKITRYTIYKNKTTPLYLYIWKE